MQTDQKTAFRILLAALILQLISIGYYLHYIRFSGYLPAPFAADKADTFMDLYNTLWWSARDGRYTEWHSIYPPLNYTLLDLMRLILVPSGVGSDPLYLRATNLWPAYLVTALHIAAPVFIVCQGGWRELSLGNRILVALVAILSPVFLFSIERGNLIILPLFFLPFLLVKKDGWWKPLLLAIVINLKPYLALLIFAYALAGDVRRFLQCLAFAGGLFLLTGLLQDPNFLLFLQNIRGFADGAILQPRQLLALPASPSAISRSIFLYLYGEGSTAGQNTILAILPPLIEVIKTGIIILVLCALFLRRRMIRIPETFVVLLFIIVSAGIWAGGYSQIFYLATVPVLMRMRFASLYLLLVLAIFLPWDLAILYSEPAPNSQSFITQETIVTTWQIGLGSIVRPVLNMGILSVFSIELLHRNVVPASQRRIIEPIWTLIPDWRYSLPSGCAGLVLGAALYHFALSSQTAIAAIRVDAGPQRDDSASFMGLLLRRETIPQLMVGKLALLFADNNGNGHLLARLTTDAKFLEVRVSMPDRAAAIRGAAAAATAALRLNRDMLTDLKMDPAASEQAHWRDIQLSTVISAASSSAVKPLRADEPAFFHHSVEQSRLISAPAIDTPIISDWRLAAMAGAVGCGAIGYAANLSRPGRRREQD